MSKTGIHPNVEDVTITCGCGATVQTQSTRGEDYHVEICSSCHPFYAGTQKIIDSAGRVEKFKAKMAAAAAAAKK